MSYTQAEFNTYDSMSDPYLDGLIWMTMLLGTTFMTMYLWRYLLHYIESGQFKNNFQKQQVFIIRCQSGQNIEERVIDYIKTKYTDRPYKIISNRVYSSEVINVKERLFLRFMKKLLKTKYDIFVFAPNNHRSSYDNYIYFAEIFKVNYHILDFVAADCDEIKTEKQIMDYEKRARIKVLV
jgi:hypothetical protein